MVLVVLGAAGGGAARSSSGVEGGHVGPRCQRVVPHERRVRTGPVAYMGPVGPLGPVARYPWEGVRREGLL